MAKETLVSFNVNFINSGKFHSLFFRFFFSTKNQQISSLFLISHAWAIDICINCIIFQRIITVALNQRYCIHFLFYKFTNWNGFLCHETKTLFTFSVIIAHFISNSKIASSNSLGFYGNLTTTASSLPKYILYISSLPHLYKRKLNKKIKSTKCSAKIWILFLARKIVSCNFR